MEIQNDTEVDLRESENYMSMSCIVITFVKAK